MQINHSHVVLDACCVLNFYASGNFLEILKAIPAQVVVTEVVRREELKTLQRLETQESSEATQLDTAIAQDLLLVVDFESEEEEEAFVNYASKLGDDGESATCAIALHRGWAVATDDKKAISFFRQEAPHLQILSTLEVVKYWSELTGVSSAKLKSVLSTIRTNGHYIPHRDHPLLNWWEFSMNFNPGE